LARESFRGDSGRQSDAGPGLSVGGPPGITGVRKDVPDLSQGSPSDRIDADRKIGIRDGQEIRPGIEAVRGLVVPYSRGVGGLNGRHAIAAHIGVATRSEDLVPARREGHLVPALGRGPDVVGLDRRQCITHGLDGVARQRGNLAPCLALIGTAPEGVRAIAHHPGPVVKLGTVRHDDRMPPIRGHGTDLGQRDCRCQTRQGKKSCDNWDFHGALQ